MARLNAHQHILTLKIVYVGPGLSGKTTNLRKLYEEYPENARGDFVQLDTGAERTVHFDYFPGNLGEIGGYRLKADFFTVPGQSFLVDARQAVLEGVDGVVFVADSSASRREANKNALRDLHSHLSSFSRKLHELPIVFQWNKRDVDDVLQEQELSADLNEELRAPEIQAIATTGQGVWESQEAILRLVVERLRSRVAGGRARG